MVVQRPTQGAFARFRETKQNQRAFIETQFEDGFRLMAKRIQAIRTSHAEMLAPDFQTDRRKNQQRDPQAS
jgi:hypothetical protein